MLFLKIINLKMNKKLFGGLVAAAFSFVLFEACSPAHGNSTGHEYMPDMGHSVAYEANKIDEYSLHDWDAQSVKTKVELWGTPRKPVNGSIARGYVGISAHGNSAEYVAMMQSRANNGVATTINGNVPYYYADSEEERTRATKEIVMNPYPITKARIENGKELWITYCGICHANNCNGNGYLVSEENPNAKYPAQPANLLLDTFVNGNNGRLYHAIMYGKNVMGGYSDKLSYEERWNVIHYIRACQAADKKLRYDENANTLKPTAAVADSVAKAISAARKPNPALQKVDTKAPAPVEHGGGAHGSGGTHGKKR
jgi:mono/diheme cytochrome c family protein